MKSLLTAAVIYILFAFICPYYALSQQCNNWLLVPSHPSYVRVGDLDIPGDKITVEAVFVRTAPWNGVDLYQGDLVSKHEDPSDVNYLLRPSSAEITTTNGYFKTPTICPIQLNKVYHAAMVYDGATLKFYRNGFLMSQVAASGNLYQNDWQTQIGLFFNQQTQENFIGYINEVRIWNSVRTQAELKTYMDKPIPSPQATPGLLAYYTFNDLKNKQGNAQWDGTLGGKAAVKQTSSYCNFIADSCGIVPKPPIVVRAGFTAPDTVCVNTPVAITNTSSGASSYYWNFSIANINTTPEAVNLGNIENKLSQPVFMDLVSDKGKYYGFLINHYPGGLIRLDFGNSFLNAPTAVPLGNFGGILPPGYGTEGIQVVQNEGKWYAIVVGGYTPSGSTPRILKVDFGTNLENSAPKATDWGNIGNLWQPIDLHIFQENNNWYGFTINAENNTITRFTFTNSFDNTPTAVNIGNIGNLDYPTGIYAMNDNGSWHVFITNGSDASTLTRLDFGNSLLNTPTAVNLGNISNALHRPRDIYLMKFCGETIGFVVNGANGYNDIVKLNFGNGLLQKPVATPLGNLGSLNFPHSISKLFRVRSDVYSFITNVNNNTISRIRFKGTSNSNISNYSGPNPPGITYSIPGVYNINLTVDDGMPTQSAFCKSVVVMPALTHTPAKQIAICDGDSVLLSNNLTRNKWSTGSTANTIYVQQPGTYWVQSTNGACNNIDTFIITRKTAPFLVNLGNDTALCKGDSIVLDAPSITGASYLWQNGQSTPKFATSIPGSYSVSVTDKGCTVRDTIILRQLPSPVVSISKDTTICPNGRVYLKAGGGIKYVWLPSATLSQNNIANPVASPLANTTYIVAVTDNNGCVAYDSVTVSLKQKPLFAIEPANATICSGDTITLKASGGDIYAWLPDANLLSPVSPVTKVFPAVTTTYGVQVKDNNCSFKDSLFTTIVVEKNPVIKVVKSNDLDCSAGQAQLLATGAQSYEWSPAISLSNNYISNPLATPLQTTTYYVKGTSGNCTSQDSITVQVLHTGLKEFYIPNAFTPNGDGKNDCFGTQYWQSVRQFSMNIYNRWGEKVFTSNNPSMCWDGTFKGIEQPADVYVYIIAVKTFCGDQTKKGTIMLIR